MDCIDKLLQDIHSQSFYNGTLINPTRFFLIASMLKDGNLTNNYSKKEIETTIFRYYVDNKSIAIRHPRPEIRNLVKYGASPIHEELKTALETWSQEAVNDSLTYDHSNIYIDIDDSVDYSGEIDYLWMVLEELFKKTYNIDFPHILTAKGNDKDIKVFGQGAYRNHLMQEIQYCVCCDEYDLDKLVAVHIVPDELSSDQNSREDIENGLIMCYVHAQEYFYKRFYFDTNGHIVNLSSSLVHRNMRLSQKLLTDNRSRYLETYKNSIVNT